MRRRMNGSRRSVVALNCLQLVLFASALHGYVLMNPDTRWPLGEIKFQVLLGPAGRTLVDGNTSWDQVSMEAVGLWNTELTPVQLRTAQASRSPESRDGINQVTWSSTVYGQSFGSAIAICIVWSSDGRNVESDILVDQTRLWDSYRDRINAHRNVSLGRYTNDLQRVLVHEFGHALGLNHPDEAGQSIDAIMNSTVSDIHYLTQDDLDGVRFLFPPESIRPKVAIKTPSNGARVLLPDLAVAGTASDNALAERVFYQLNGGAFAAAVTTNEAATINWSAIVTLAPGSNVFTVKSVDTSTNESALVSRRFFRIVTNALTLVTNGTGSISPNLAGLGLEIGRSYTVTALPGAGHVFSNWTGGVTSSLARLSFLMRSNLVLEANFVTNPFTPLKGTFTGLFRETGAVRHESSGFFTLKLTDAGSYSGKLLLAGKSHSISGRFDLDGRATNRITRTGTNTPLSLEIFLDLGTNSAGRITGTLTDGVWLSDLAAHRTVFHATTNPAPWAGTYTMILGGTNDPGAGPGGDSYGTIKVDLAGNVKLSGKLADKTSLAQKAPLSVNGEWPLHASLYSSKGSLSGWLQFDTNAAGIDGTVSWFKPAATKGLYIAGFTNQSGLIGSRYLPPATKTNRVVAMTNGIVTLSRGNLSDALTNHVVLSQDNKVTATNLNMALRFTLSSGLFKGSFVDPASAKKISFNGVLLQNSNVGSGFFTGTNQSGRVRLEAVP